MPLATYDIKDGFLSVLEGLTEKERAVITRRIGL